MSNIERIANLLAVAERASTPEEAASFLAKAQNLATLHSVDLAVAQSKIAQREKREQPTNRQITIGDPGKHVNKHLISLFSAVAGNNDVTIDIAHRSTYVIAFGFPSDLEVVEAMWGSLAFQMVQAGNAYIAAGEWKDETYLKYESDYWSGQRTVRKNHTASTARTSFYRGFISAIDGRLATARREAIAEAEAAARADRENALYNAMEEFERDIAGPANAQAAAEAAAQPSGTELVLKEKKEEVRSYYKKASTARGSWKGYRGSVDSSGHAGSAGRTAAKNARLSASKAVGSRAGEVSG